MKADPNRVITWLLVFLVPLAGGLGLLTLLLRLRTEVLERIVEKQFAVVVGLPLAAALAALIVIGLRHTEGPIKFKGLGFEFEGTSGQVVLWVVCFLAIAGAIRLLWT
jgi:uncharacterized membrane protein YjgN (DUF898 family)